MIGRIFIAPAHQNLGVGSILLKQLIERARMSKKLFKLRVLRVNPARRLYERHGFVVSHSTDHHHHMVWTGV